MRLAIENIKTYNIRVILLMVALIFVICQVHELFALPVYRNTEHGSTSVNSTSVANTIKVTLSSQVSSLNWEEFDIDTGEEVIFNFLKPGSISINKVLGPSGLSSWIQGNLTGIGMGASSSFLILSDPNGIQVASTSTITGFQQLTLTNLEPLLTFQDGFLTNIDLELYSEVDYPATTASTIAVLGDINLSTPGAGVDLISTNGSYASGVVQLGPAFVVNAKSHMIFVGRVKDIDDYITISRFGNQIVSREINIKSATNLPSAEILGAAYMDHPLSPEAIASFPTYNLPSRGGVYFDPTAQKYYFNVKGFAGPTRATFRGGTKNTPTFYYSPNLTRAYIFKGQTVNPQGYTEDGAAGANFQPYQLKLGFSAISSVAYDIPERMFYAGFDIDLGAPIIKEIFPVIYSVLINDYLQELYPAIPYLTHSDRKSISKRCTYFAPRTLDEAIALSQRKTPINGNWLAESNELNIDCHTGLNSGPLVLFDINSLLLNSKNKEFFVDERVFLDEKGKQPNGSSIKIIL